MVISRHLRVATMVLLGGVALSMLLGVIAHSFESRVRMVVMWAVWTGSLVACYALYSRRDRRDETHADQPAQVSLVLIWLICPIGALLKSALIITGMYDSSPKEAWPSAEPLWWYHTVIQLTIGMAITILFLTHKSTRRVRIVNSYVVSSWLAQVAALICWRVAISWL